MKITFQNANGNHFARMPQTERRDKKRYIRFSYAGCTGYLILRSPLEKPADLLSEELQHAIVSLGDRISFGEERQLPGMEHISIRYVTHSELFRGNDSIEIPEGAASYAVCGVVVQGEEFRILLPLDKKSSTTAVAVELPYSIRRHEIEKRKLFRTVREQTDFYQVSFERRNGYVSGMAYYTIGNSGLRYPVVEKMIGATTLIKTNGQIPEFHVAVPGVILIKK